MIPESPALTLDNAVDLARLEEAWLHVRARKAAGGLDSVTLGAFETRLHAELTALRRAALDGAYVPEPVLTLQIPKSSHPGERRTIGLASVRDKVLQQALRSVLEPAAERLFLDCSYGYRPGKGPAKAIARVAHHLVALKHTFVATADIDRFFDTLRHDLVLAQVRALGADADMQQTIALWLGMGTVDRQGRWHDVSEGVTQGSVVSPLLANLYLHPLDLHLRSSGFLHVRYADDFVITGTDEGACAAALATAADYLRAELGLLLNPQSRPVRPVSEGFVFLGVHFDGMRRTLAPEKTDSMRRSVQGLIRLEAGDPVPQKLAMKVAGWRRYYGSVLPRDVLADVDCEFTRTLVTAAADALRVRTPEEVRRLVRWLTPVGTLTLESDSSVTGLALADALRLAGVPASRVAPASVPARTAARPPTAATAQPVRRRKRQHLRTRAASSVLVVREPGSFVGRSGGRIVVRRQGRPVASLRPHDVSSLRLAEHGVSISTDALVECASHGIAVIVENGIGRAVAVSTGETGLAGAVAEQQVRVAIDPLHGLRLAKAFAGGKVHNQRALLKGFLKYRSRADRAWRSDLERYDQLVRSLQAELHQIAPCADRELARSRVMSVEGRAASAYWAFVRRMAPAHLVFPGRAQDGHDVVNAMLNYGYAVLQSRAHLALLDAGLLPSVSFLHAARRTEPTLAFDLMEEFRPVVVDRVVLSMLGRREPVAVGADGRLQQTTRHRLLRRLQDRLGTLLVYRSREATLGEIVGAQARALRVDVESGRPYRPYLARW